MGIFDTFKNGHKIQDELKILEDMIKHTNTKIVVIKKDQIQAAADDSMPIVVSAGNNQTGGLKTIKISMIDASNKMFELGFRLIQVSNCSEYIFVR